MNIPKKKQVLVFFILQLYRKNGFARPWFETIRGIKNIGKCTIISELRSDE